MLHESYCLETDWPYLVPQVIQLWERELVFTRQSKQSRYLRMATVSASGELAHGQMTSGRSPLDWKTLRNASQEDMDPA